MMCFRNTVIEDFHGGIAPVSHTGDFSDVVVIDANGRRIPWPEEGHDHRPARIGEEPPCPDFGGNANISIPLV